MEESRHLCDKSETSEPLHQEEIASPSVNESSESHPSELDKLLPKAKTLDQSRTEVSPLYASQDSNEQEAKLYTQSQYQIFEEVVPEVDLDVINEIKPSFQKNSNQTVQLNQVEEKLNVDTMETAGADSHLTAQNQHHSEDVAEVKSFTVSLLELAFEKQMDISSAAISTLQNLGRKHPATVLRVLVAHLSGSDLKTSARIRSIIFTILESTINPAIENNQLDFQLAGDLIKMASTEMISVESTPDIQLPASNILVAVGTVYCKDVIQLLGTTLTDKPNAIPHSYVLISLSSLATLNIYGTVPHLSKVLTALVTLLPQIKTTVHRCHFSTTLAKFSEAVIFYLANIDRAPDPCIERLSFSEDVARAFEILFVQWLPCKTAGTCQEILEALGQMSQLLTEERLELVAPKLVPCLIQTYRGPVESLYVSRCLALFLDAFFSNAHLELSETILQDMFQSLFQQVTILPDYSQPATIKNHYEVLRCFERVARAHLEKVIFFLLQKTENPSEKVRVATLTVLKHLLNALKDQMAPQILAIQLQLKPLLIDNQNAVRKALVQTIVAMAVQGHLNTVHSDHFIAFLLKLCTLSNPVESSGLFLNTLASRSSTGSNPASVSHDELKQMCENVIHLLVTTQTSMDHIFWPRLLHYALNVDYCRAIGVIAKALAHISKTPNFTVDIDSGDLPSSEAIVARFLVLARSPLPLDKCTAVLQFLQHYAVLIDPSLNQLWAQEIPLLLETAKNGDSDEWLTGIERLVYATFATMKVGSLPWVQQLAKSLVEQVTFYEDCALERGFLFHVIGLAVHHGAVQQGPSYGMDFIMTSIRHHLLPESQGCAAALGWCSRNHADGALQRLHNLERNDYGRKSAGFLSFMKDSRSESEVDHLKATAARSYARIAAQTPVSELLLKVDKQMIRGVLYVLQSSKDWMVRQEGLEAICCIARALLPELIQQRYILPGRADLLQESLAQLKSTPLPDDISSSGSPKELQLYMQTSQFIVRSLQAIAALVQLPPSLLSDNQSILAEAGLERGIILYTKLCHYAVEECSMVEASLAANQLLMAMEQLMLNLLRQSLDPGSVDVLFSQLLPWMRSPQEASRRAALALFKLVLATFVNEIAFEPGAPTRFSQGHIMLAKILVRCTDPVRPVRDLAIDAVGLVLDIMAKYLGYSRSYEQETVATLDRLKVHLGSDDPQEPLETIATILHSKIAPSDLWSFLEAMTDGLLDTLPASSSGLSLLMCIILKKRGGEIHLHIKELLDLLLGQLKSIQHLPTRRFILNAVCLLTSHQSDTVVGSLLTHSLPHNDDVSDCWKALAGEPSLSQTIVEHLMDIMASAAPYEERSHAHELIASVRLLSAISAFNCMCQVPQLSPVLQTHFAQLLCMLMLAQGCLLNTSPPIHFNNSNSSGSQLSFVPNREAYRLNPYQMTTEALIAFAKCADLASLAELLLEHRFYSNAGDLAVLCDMVAAVTQCCAAIVPAHILPCTSYLTAALKSTHQRHRLVAVAFYAELVHQRSTGTDAVQLDNIIKGLTSSLPDSSPSIRRMALRGLGALGHCNPHHLESFAPVVLNALMNGLEEDGRDKQETNSGTANEALEGLMAVIPVAPLVEVERLASRLALRVRPFFEHEEAKVRHAAVSLLASLFLAGSNTSARVHLAEQVHTTLTSLLLHLNESDAEVVRACKAALRQAGPLLDCKAINTMFQTHLPDEGRLNYSTFLTDVVKLMAVDLNEWISSHYLLAALSYFKSPAPQLRANAALLVGLFCGHIPSAEHRNVSVSLTRLLHDPSKIVRLQAIEAISLMFA